MADGGDPARLTVGINAQLRTGEAGGVEQFVVGLAWGLSQLTDGDETYLFLTVPGEAGWIRPFVGGAATLVDRSVMRRGARRAAAVVRHRVVRALPWLKRVKAAIRRAASESDALPVSDGTLERLGCDVVHFPYQAAFLTALPSIYQPWDLQHLHLPELFSLEASTRRERHYRAFCSEAAMVVVASEWARRDIVEKYGIEPEKTAVIAPPPPVAVYPQPTRTDIARTRARFGLPPRFLLYPAQTFRHKNHVRLLEALTVARERVGFPIPLVCTGLKNEHFAEVRATMDRIGIEGVDFLGFVEPVHMAALYRLADALVFPSRFEGWGLPVVEALSQGLPVACAAVTSLPELVDGAAVLFDPDDTDDIARAIGAIWTDDALRKRLAAAGPARVSSLSWVRVARTFRALYRTVAGRPLSPEDVQLYEAAVGLPPRPSES